MIKMLSLAGSARICLEKHLHLSTHAAAVFSFAKKVHILCPLEVFWSFSFSLTCGQPSLAQQVDFVFTYKALRQACKLAGTQPSGMLLVMDSLSCQSQWYFPRESICQFRYFFGPETFCLQKQGQPSSVVSHSGATIQCITIKIS